MKVPEELIKHIEDNIAISNIATRMVLKEAFKYLSEHKELCLKLAGMYEIKDVKTREGKFYKGDVS